MLAKLSIRAKIVAVVSLLLISLAATGLFGLMQMRSQNANLVDIQTNWLPGVRTLGDLRASAITYRIVVRDLLILTDPEARARTEKTLETVGQTVDKLRVAYEPLITSDEERQIYREFTRKLVLLHHRGARPDRNGRPGPDRRGPRPQCNQGQSDRIEGGRRPAQGRRTEQQGCGRRGQRGTARATIAHSGPCLARSQP